MNTEIADNKDARWRGTLFYDAGCGLCSATIHRFGPMLERRLFVLTPLQSEVAQRTLGLEVGELPGEMKLLREDGTLLGGANAVIFLMRHVWWLWPMAMLLALPGMRFVAHGFYRWLARNRYGFNSVCAVTPQQRRRVIPFLEIP